MLWHSVLLDVLSRIGYGTQYLMNGVLEKYFYKISPDLNDC